MIQINLLPPEYRPRDKTNLPLMVTIAAGLLVFGTVCLYGIKLSDELAGLNSKFNELSESKARYEQQAKEVRNLKEKIARAKARQDTIIEISQSKVMWSLKLQQFSHVLSDFPGFWISRLTLARAGRGGAGLNLDMAATGSSLREVARFRDALKNDPNFFYHFGDLVSHNVGFEPLPPGFNFTEQMNFRIDLPLRAAPVATKKKKKK